MDSTAIQLRRAATILVAAAVGLLAGVDAQAQEGGDYERATHGTRVLENGGLRIKMLVERFNLGSSEVEIAEITFPAGSSPSRGHRHGSIEIFYILSGELDHVVNGQSHRLKPGMVGMVKPEDEVIHRVVSDVPVRALVIWAPGGEADRLARFSRSALSTRGRPPAPPRERGARPHPRARSGPSLPSPASKPTR